MVYAFLTSGVVKSFNLCEISVAWERVVAMATKDKKTRTRKSKPQTPAKPEPIEVPRHRLASHSARRDSLAQSGSVGTGLPDIVEHLGNQLCSCLWFADDLTPEEATKQVHTALEFLVKLAPRNELEAMLAVQAIATHNAAMDCMMRAMTPGRSAAAYDLCLKHAEKLLRIFKEQAELISRNQRHAPLLAADHSETQTEGEEVSAGAEGENDSTKGEQSDTLCDLRAYVDAKKAG